MVVWVSYRGGGGAGIFPPQPQFPLLTLLPNVLLTSNVFLLQQTAWRKQGGREGGREGVRQGGREGGREGGWVGY